MRRRTQEQPADTAGSVRLDKAPADPPTGQDQAGGALARPAGKGRPTPKRKDKVGSRAPAPPPPRTRKEAYQRIKAQGRVKRSQARAGIARGDARFLGRRDAGPVRALVRDVVDSRRNALWLFLPSAILLFFGGSLVPVTAVRGFSATLWLGVVALMTVDGFVLCRIVKRTLRDRFPDHEERMSALYFYAVTRASQFRRLRLPKPRVGVGDTI